MDKSEPALVPEWLRGTSGGTNGGGSSLHHIASLSQSDDYSMSNSVRSKAHPQNGNNSSRTLNKKSSHFRRNSRSNSAILNEKVSSLRSRSYISFSRSHRERDWDRNFDGRGKGRSALHGHYDFSDPLMLSTDVLVGREERDALQRSFSGISAKRGELLSKKSANGGLNSKPYAAGSMLSPQSIKSTFERDFPSLGFEEKTGAPEVRVKSPGLSSASPSLPMNSSTVIGGDGWTSVLAEVPIIIGGSSSLVLPAAESAPVSSGGMSMSSNSGFNMAEALVHAPGRGRTAPQLSIETQRLEELAIKQSRQLIPVTPSMPKSAALLTLDKSKSKSLRSNESSSASKAGQQVVNHSLRGSSKSDSVKNSQPNSNFVILNRERNGFPNFPGDETLSPTHANTHSITSPAATVAPLRSPTAVKLQSVGAKVTQISATDKKHTSHSQNRNEFFNSLRKKTSANNDHVSAASDSALSVTAEKHEEHSVEHSSDFMDDGKVANFAAGSALACFSSDGENAAISSSGGGGIPCSDEQKLIDSSVALPDEEEEAFLKSLGWDATAEEEALTEEEIQVFLKEYKKLTPTSKLCEQYDRKNLGADMESPPRPSVSNSNV